MKSFQLVSIIKPYFRHFPRIRVPYLKKLHGQKRLSQVESVEMATGTNAQLNQCIRFRSFRLMMLVFIFTTRINKSEGSKMLS